MSKDEEHAAFERKFLLNPSEWPRWPLLPMKRRDGNWQDKRFCAIKFAEDAFRLYFTNMYAFAGLEPQPKTWGEALDGIEFKDYLTIDALLEEYAVD